MKTLPKISMIHNSLALAAVLTVAMVCSPAVGQPHDVLRVTNDGIPLARGDVIPIRTAITGSSGSSTDLSQAKISGRATDAKMQGFLARTSLQQLATVYREASQMVDQRHVSPPSYEARSMGAIQNLINALDNEHFLRANGANVNRQNIQSVQSQLMQIAQASPARDVNGAVALMQTAAEVVARGTGIRREAAGLEFMNGMMDTLDQYSAFQPEVAGVAPGAMNDLVITASLNETQVGLGVELKAHDQGAELVGIVENSPAAEVGLLEGDIIVSVNNRSMAGLTLNQVADSLSGSAGTSVSLEILRNGQKFRGTVVRRSFYVSSITGAKIIDTTNGTAYLRMKQFSESSARDLERTLTNLHNQGMKSLVFDLRGNPGGLLDVCVEVSDMFLPRGTIVSTRGRNASDNSQEVATGPKTWSVPLVVLVDENSASASEIFAAAIQENGRGVVVGRKSYGKGTVQTHFPMNSVSAILKLTTAKFYSPNGREMAGTGVTPDVPVNLPEGTRLTNDDADVQTARHLIASGIPYQMIVNLSNGNANPYYAITPVNNNVPGYNNVPNYNGAPTYNTVPHNNIPQHYLGNNAPRYNNGSPFNMNGNGYENGSRFNGYRGYSNPGYGTMSPRPALNLPAGVREL